MQVCEKLPDLLIWFWGKSFKESMIFLAWNAVRAWVNDSGLTKASVPKRRT